MTGLIAAVRGRIDGRCLANGRLNKEGCRVSLADAPRPRVIVDFDRPGAPQAPGGNRCDYLFFAEGDGGHVWIAPLELKRGPLHADQAVRQLQAGAAAAEALVGKNEPVRFRPVAASGRTPKAERNGLKNRKNRIRFHERTEPVRLMSCGARLVRALGS